VGQEGNAARVYDCVICDTGLSRGEIFIGLNDLFKPPQRQSLFVVVALM